MANGGINLLIEQVQQRVAHKFMASWEQHAGDYGSPIEALLAYAITGQLMLSGNGEGAFIGEIANKEDFRAQAYLCHRLYGVGQARLLDWPVDFLFATADSQGRGHFAAVECDGHEFHERTKEQARRDRSRDRRLQDAGFRVFRFTGSEIYGDPLGCAGEIVKWAADIWFSEESE